MYMHRGAKMRSSGGRQGVARGSPGGRHPCVTRKIYHRRPKSLPTELILEPLDANFAAQVPIFDNLLVNFMFFNRILWIYMDSDQIFDDFQRIHSLGTSNFAIPYNKFEGFCILQGIASQTLLKPPKCSQDAPKSPPGPPLKA